MKKGFSIFITVFILVSGMHLSIASHLCQGKVVAVKWSFSGKLAGCGMEAPVKSCPVHGGIASNCCHNKIVYFTLDNSYIPSTLQDIDLVTKYVKTHALPVNNLLNSLKPAALTYANVSPPGKSFPHEVNLANICVFLI